MTFPYGGQQGYGTYPPYQTPLFGVNDEDMQAFQDCMLGDSSAGNCGSGAAHLQPPHAQQQQGQGVDDEDIDLNLGSAYDIPDFDLACAFLDAGIMGNAGGPSSTSGPGGDAPPRSGGGSNNNPMGLLSLPGGGGGNAMTNAFMRVQSGGISTVAPQFSTNGSSMPPSLCAPPTRQQSPSNVPCTPLPPSPALSSSSSAPPPPAVKPERSPRAGPAAPPQQPPASQQQKRQQDQQPAQASQPQQPPPPQQFCMRPPAPCSSASSAPPFARASSTCSSASSSSSGVTDGSGGGPLETRTNSTGSTSSTGSRSVGRPGSRPGSNGKRRRNEPKTKTTEQLEKIRERNRILARKTRLRKKMVYEQLQKQVSELKRENNRLRGSARLQQRARSDSQGDDTETCRESMCSTMDEDTVSGGAPSSPSFHTEAAFRSLVSEAQHTFCVTDACAPGHPIMYASPSFLQASGFAANQLFGGDLGFLKGPLTDHGTIAAFYRCLEDGVETSLCFQTYRADGTSYWAQHYLAPLRNREGKVIQTVVMQCPVNFTPILDDEEEECDEEELLEGEDLDLDCC